MNCPTCGAPNVILRKDIWECGWCGDSGFIPGYILEQRNAAKTVHIPKEITLTLTVEPSENEDTPEHPIFFDSAVERIVEQFPELKDEYESETLSGIMGAQLLEKVYRHVAIPAGKAGAVARFTSCGGFLLSAGLSVGA